MRIDCKWYSNEKCGHGTYNEGLSFIHEDLSPCTVDCKGYYNREKYFEDLKNPKEYLKRNYGHLKLDV